MSPSKARESVFERTPITNDIVLFRSPAIGTRKVRYGMKIYIQPKKRALVNKVVKWDRGWWHKHTKQTSPRSPISIVIEDSGKARGACVLESPLGR